jgi:ACS family glucarate transporter-like MFS transporter
MFLAMSAIAYFQQKGVTIAAERIMPELSLSQMQIGWIQWAFLLAYTPSQVISGLVGRRFGARVTLAVAGAVAVAATIAMPLVPALLTGGAVFAGLFLSQLVLGLAQAPTFPVGQGILRAWLPTRRWGLASGLSSMSAQLGAAAAPAVIVFLMQRFGWQRALFWTALPSLALVVGWAWYVRNTPGEHASVSTEELADLKLPGKAPSQDAATPTIRARLPLWEITLLTASYTSMNYVFYLLANWSFLYLVQERHFTVAQSGWLATLPPLAAAFGAGAGGGVTDALGAKFGIRWGYRVVPLVSLPTIALLLVLAVSIAGPLTAVAGMTLCYGLVELNEGAYWAAITHFGGENIMVASGILNTGGSLGGLIGIPIVAYLSGHGAWNTAFLIGASCATFSAVAWFGIDATRSESGAALGRGFA